MYRWSEIQPQLVKGKDGVSQVRLNNSMESWYMEFTDKQIAVLDYFLERKSIDWFAEKSSGIYHIKDFYEDWKLDYYIYADGAIRMEGTAEEVFSSLAAFSTFEEENEF